MTKLQARMLLLVLVAKRIPFTLKRDGSHYVISFDMRESQRVIEAVGA
jgi:hypothetical protein